MNPSIAEERQGTKEIILKLLDTLREQNKKGDYMMAGLNAQQLVFFCHKADRLKHLADYVNDASVR